MTTVQLDNLAAEIVATMTTKHADYAILAARIVVSNLHKETKASFSGKFTQYLVFLFSIKITFIFHYFSSQFFYHFYKINVKSLIFF